MNPFLSVVVPIYQVEAYLRECVDSILCQTFSDMEIILVDDGSPDGCPTICDEYARNDSRVKVIHKPNGGLVSARKAGVRQASGRYITFVDSDDWIEPDMYSVMKNLADSRGADVIITDFFHYRKGVSTRFENKMDAGYYEGERLEELRNRMIYFGEFYSPGVYPSVWNKWFRREILIPNLEAIDEKISLGEDMACTYPCILDAHSVEIYKEKCFYNYRWRPESMIVTMDPFYFRKFVSLYGYLKECFEKKGRPDMEAQLVYHKVYTMIFGTCLKYAATLKDIFSGKSRKCLEECYDNSDVRLIIADIHLEKLKIPKFYLRIYQAFLKRKTWALIWSAQVIRLKLKLGR